jgi:hypothetical protein
LCESVQRMYRYRYLISNKVVNITEGE